MAYNMNFDSQFNCDIFEWHTNYDINNSMNNSMTYDMNFDSSWNREWSAWLECIN